MSSKKKPIPDISAYAIVIMSEKPKSYEWVLLDGGVSHVTWEVDKDSKQRRDSAKY